jgi:eukaryotic-like serine/threonine-protein kinase
VTQDDAFANTLAPPSGGEAAQLAQDTRVPELIADRYRITGRIGAGGFGVVFEATDERLQKRVAVKLLGEQHSRDKQQVERFRSEALSASRLNDPNIVTVTDFEVLPDGRPYLVMEYIAGRPFDQALAQEKPLPVAKAVRIARKLCLALGKAHHHGIVHRDLKPANIIVDDSPDREGGILKILDFGVAKLLEKPDKPNLTSTGQMLGTPAYMAPEQIRQRDEPLDGRADLYAVGVILYEMLTGTTPFANRPSGDVLVSKVIERPESPARHNPSLPPNLVAIVMRAIQKKPTQRYANAFEMAAALAPFAEETLSGTAPAGILRRRAWPAVVGLGAIGAVAAAVAFNATSGGPAPARSTPGPVESAPVGSATAEPPAPAVEATFAPPVSAAAPPEPATSHVPADAGAAEAAPSQSASADRDSPPPSRKRPQRAPKKTDHRLPDSPLDRIRLPR